MNSTIEDCKRKSEIRKNLGMTGITKMERVRGRLHERSIAMNIAVLSDIHANYIAFRKVVEFLKTKDIDAICFLGDYSGEFAGVQETFDLIYELQEQYQVYIIKGNKEDYLLYGIGDEHPEWDAYPSTVGMIRYNHNSMREKDWAFIKLLPETLTVKIEGMEDLFLCHGSPRAVKEKIYERGAENKDILQATQAKYILCGHTHRCMNFEEYGKIVFNPGSVGDLLDDGMHDYASFMIIHSAGKEWECEHFYLRHDMDEIVKDMMNHNLHKIAPYWSLCTEACMRGVPTSNGEILERAMVLTEDETGVCNWPAIPEKYWARAFREIVIEQEPEIYEKMMLKVVRE